MTDADKDKDKETIRGERDRALERADRAEAEIEKLKSSKEPKKPIWEALTSMVTWQNFTAGIIILAVCGSIAFAVFDDDFLRNLQQPSYARGLITFVFTMGTLGIGVILTAAALSPGEEAGKSFTRGKEIFTVLVGILGTIIGFYFGTGTA